MKQICIIMALALVAPMLTMCGTSRGAGAEASKQAAGKVNQGKFYVPAYQVLEGQGPGIVVGGSSHALPKAVIYKTNGNYNNNVPITLNATGTAIISYPAPSDVSVNSAPVELIGSWLLDRRGGVGTNTAFTTYTYAEYAALPQAPSPEALMKAIIPGARVTQCRVLDISAQQALTQPQLVDSIIARGLTPEHTLKIQIP